MANNNKLLRFVLYGTFIAIFLMAFTLYAQASTNSYIIPTVNDGYVATVDTNTTQFNMTTQMGPAMKNVSLIGKSIDAVRYYPIYEFNISQWLPCNITIQDVVFRFWVAGYDAAGANGSSTRGTALMSYMNKPINQTTSTDLLTYCYVTSLTAAYHDDDFLFDQFPTVVNYTTFGPQYKADATYWGLWFDSVAVYGAGNNLHNISAAILSNITNYTMSSGLLHINMFQTTSSNNATLGTSVNTSAPTIPRLVVNYTYTISNLNSTSLTNNSVLSSPATSFTYFFNISNANNNRSKFQVFLYDNNTGERTTLQNITYTAPTGSIPCYNQSLSIYVGNITANHGYKIWVHVIGNDTDHVEQFYLEASVSACYSTNLTMYPSNEGYVLYDSAGGTYSKYTTWANSLSKIDAMYNGTEGKYKNIFFEWNLSHYIPLDAQINAINFTYYGITKQYPAAVPVFCWCALLNTNNTNTTSASALYASVATGTSMQDDTGGINRWFAGPSSDGPNSQTVLNRSTYYTAIDANHEGFWYKVGVIDAQQRNIRAIIEQNLSNSNDKFIIGGALGGASQPNSAQITSSINSSAPVRPYMYVNCTYNISGQNYTYFTNGSTQFRQPWIFFNVSNNLSSPITYYIMIYNESNGSWFEQQFNRSCTSGNQTIHLTGANAYGTWYRWYLVVVGNSSTPIAMYRFETEELPIAEPPTNVTCHDYNSTTLNISYTPFNATSFTTYTICYYTTGLIAPIFGGGTFGGNNTGNITYLAAGSTSNWFNISGLTKSTYYTFAFWTYIDSTVMPTYSMLSTNFTYITNRTAYGTITFVLRNETVDPSSNTNKLINLTQFNSTHRLVIHYENATSTITFFNWSTYNSGGGTANQTITISQQPIFFEFEWNYSVNASNYDVGIGQTWNQFSSQYNRILTPYADTIVGATEYCTFYLTVDKLIYNQYYWFNGSNATLADDINNLVDYNYQFNDQSGFFGPTNSYTSYASIFTYVGEDKIIIDQRYIDSSAKIAPTLNYHSYYYIGIASTTSISSAFNNYYINLGQIPTEKIVSPYIETIIIYPISTEYQENLTGITTQSFWLTNGFYANYSDIGFHTNKIMFTVYNNSDGNMITIFWVNGTSGYNYHYISADAWHPHITYRVIINISYTFDSGITNEYQSSVLLIFKPTNNITSTARINALFHTIFGDSPWYNPETGASVPYFSWIIAFIAIILLLGAAAVGQAMLGMFISGVTFIGSGFVVSGAPTAFIITGAMLIFVTIIYALFKGVSKQ